MRWRGPVEKLCRAAELGFESLFPVFRGTFCPQLKLFKSKD
jgi:hypothetical protein